MNIFNDISMHEHDVFIIACAYVFGHQLGIELTRFIEMHRVL